jgi:hypothetical protein
MKHVLLLLSLFFAGAISAQNADCATLMPAGYAQTLQQRITNLPATRSG